MRTLLLPLFFTIALVLFTHPAHAEKEQYIELNVPASIISKIIADVVPLQIQTDSSVLTGNITVVDVQDLLLENQKISCRILLAGRDMQLVTELAGHQINMKVGNIDLDFLCNALVRFEEASQTLYIKPVVNDQSAGQNEADIGQALIGLLNGREFPIAIEQIKPIVAETNNKTITLSGHIADLVVSEYGLGFKILPIVDTQ